MKENYKRILVPTDFTETGDNALYAAMVLASKFKSEIYLAHFYHVPVQVDITGQQFMPAFDSESEAELAKEGLERIAKEISVIFPAERIHTVVQMGFMADEIADVCQEHNIDLIVCGTNGTEWPGEHFIGTNATAVVQKSSVPVLVIPKKAKLKGINKIIFSTDFQFDDLNVLSDVNKLAVSFQSRLDVVHISKEAKKEEDTIEWMAEIVEQRIHNPNLHFSNKVSSKSAAEALLEIISKEKPDVVVLTTKGKNVLERIFGGSTSRELMCHSSVPLLVYHVHDHKIY